MNDIIKIKVLCNSDYFLNYLINHNIKYYDLKKKNNCFYLNVNIKDFNTLSKMFECNIVKYYGKNYIKFFFIEHKYLIVSFIISIFILSLLCNTIFEIEIKTNNEMLKNDIMNILSNYDISINKRKKHYDEIEMIKKKILNELDSIEWIEINEIGCKYIVNVNERVNNNDYKDFFESDIIAKKDGLIKHIVVYNGTKIKEENEYVSKGEVIISGGVYKEDELINYENAMGEVYAETWYVTKVNIPFNYKKKVKTGKIINHYYIQLFNKDFSIIGKYSKNNMDIKRKILVDKPYLLFKLYKEEMIEYNIKNVTLDEKQAYELGLVESEKFIKNNFNDNEFIISKKVLKKEVNSSTMYLEVFYKVYENIGETSDVIIKE